MSYDDELLGEFVVEAKEHLADIENQFLSIEASGDNVDVELVNEVFRGIHSIKGAAGFLGMTKVNDLSHCLENILNMMRNSELSPNSAMIDVMLRSADRLQGLIDDIFNSNEADVSEYIDALEQIAAGGQPDGVPGDSESEPLGTEEASEEIPATPESDEAAEAEQENETASAPLQKATPEPQATSTGKPAAASSPIAPEASIRVSVGVLDKLMNLAGELVLSRNQLMQAIATKTDNGLDTIASRLDQVTSEVQESIMQTRMQQIGTVFAKFPRIVRDLSSKLGKQCQLNIEGKEVEVDKTIIEAMGDPLTHLIRNSIDHGVELPADRKKRGKPAEGTMNLRAFCQAGKVRIEIEDDGAGIDPIKLKEKAVAKGVITAERAEQMGDREALRLVFHPGLSMAAKVTDVSGRGVGMDVVRTNISKLGGTVEVDSIVGAGTKISITLPLTLAIIPSLIVQSQNQRFAIPQVNIAELVRVRREEIDKRIGHVKDAEVLRLRGDLLPLLRLEHALSDEEDQAEPSEEQEAEQLVREAINIIVLETGQQRFGVIVDGLHDSEEIVVKPLGRHLKDCPYLSGATILGDGHVALILDVAGIANHEQIRCVEKAVQEENKEKKSASDQEEDTQFMLLFSNHPSEHFAVSMEVISRIERIRADQVDSVGGHELLQYRSTTMSLLRLENCITAKPPEPKKRLYVVVFEVAGNEVGLVAPALEDIRDVSMEIDTVTLSEKGVMGSMVLAEQTTRYIDLFEIAKIAHPEWFEDCNPIIEEEGHPPKVLLAEDSTFFRKTVSEMIRERGYDVIDCEDGLEAWKCLNSGEHEFDIVVTDIEMPNMDGFELSQRIKQSDQWSWMPVIALTSLAGSADVQHGIEVGIDDYQIKMDREKLLNSIHNFTGAKAGNNRRVLHTT